MRVCAARSSRQTQPLISRNTLVFICVVVLQGFPPSEQLSSSGHACIFMCIGHSLLLLLKYHVIVVSKAITEVGVATLDVTSTYCYILSVPRSQSHDPEKLASVRQSSPGYI